MPMSPAVILIQGLCKLMTNPMKEELVLAAMQTLLDMQHSSQASLAEDKLMLMSFHWR